MTLKVGDTLRTPTNSGGFRVWKVVGVFLGGEGQESVIGLMTLDRSYAAAHGRTHDIMYIPEQILEDANLERC